MKLILFADKLPPEIGGMETHAKYFIQYFDSKCELTIITKRDNSDYLVDSSLLTYTEIDLLPFLEPFGGERCVVFYNSGRRIECFATIKQILPHALFFYRTGGNEIVKAPLSFPIPNHADRQKFWVDTLNRNIDVLIANSQFTRKRLLDLGVRDELIKIISGGIDAQRVEFSIANRFHMRKSINCPDNEKLLVCCCRFVEYKRPMFLLKAFALLGDRCRVVLAGDGPLLDEAKNYSARLKMDNIEFLGRLSQEEALNLIAASDVYCQASTDLKVQVEGGCYVHTEGMGRSIIEAVCCGVKVVATDCGALREFVTNKNGVLVKGDERAFAEAISNVLRFSQINESERIINVSLFDFSNIFKIYSQLWAERKYC